MLGGGALEIALTTNQSFEQLTGRRILVIDDEESVRMVLATMLQACGAEVATAADGSIGLDMLQQNDYDLVMVDWNMPEMSGLEVIRHVKACKPDVPTIICSGNVNDCADLATDEKPNSILQKPLGLSRIASEINQVLRATSAD